MSLPAPGPDRTALVTGASSGIGVELARLLSVRGHGVTLVARSVDRLEVLAGELRGLGVRAEVVAADLADRSAREALPHRLADLGLSVDVLVNNAGLSTSGPVHASDPEAEMHMIEVDVVAVADLCTRFLPAMVERGRGAVLNVASVGAFQPVPGQAGYGAAKAFVLSYTHALRGELHGTGVVASVLCPGPVETGFGATAGIAREDATRSLPGFLWETPETVARVGLDGLAANRAVTVPGAANRAASIFGHLTPRTLLVPLVAGRHPRLKA
jgi:short-subunit dehydrogenase